MTTSDQLRVAYTYALISSFSTEPRYVGVATDRAERMKAHMWAMNHRVPLPVHDWMHSVRARGGIVMMETLTVWPTEAQAYVEEARLIPLWRARYRLLNVSDGGYGGGPSAGRLGGVARAKRMASDPDFREGMLVHQRTAGKLGAAVIAAKAASDPEFRKVLARNGQRGIAMLKVSGWYGSDEQRAASRKGALSLKALEIRECKWEGCAFTGTQSDMRHHVRLVHKLAESNEKQRIAKDKLRKCKQCAWVGTGWAMGAHIEQVHGSLARWNAEARTCPMCGELIPYERRHTKTCSSTCGRAYGWQIRRAKLTRKT